MTKTSSQVTLYIPGLFHFIPEFSEEELSELFSLRSLLSLGKAKEIARLDYLDQVADLFQLKNTPFSDHPFAALSRLSDDASRPQGSWMRVDPVHLQTSPKGLILMDSRQFSLSQHDALALAATVQEEFKQANCELEVPVADRWYIKLPNTPQIKTEPIHHVAGQNIADYMLAGEHEKTWLQLFNQLQMLLHDSEINKTREANAEPVINSLWFWGAGELPEQLTRVWSQVISDDKIVKGLAMLSSSEYSSADEFKQTMTEHRFGNDLFIMDELLQSVQYDAPLGWLETVRKIESDYLAPLMQLLKQGTIKQLDVYTENYHLQLQQKALKQFWRRRKKLKSFFE